jgi:hypothetical protein
MQATRLGLWAAGALALAGAVEAKDRTTVGISLEASTLGAGLSVGVPVGQRFNLRGVYHAYSHDDEFEDDAGGTYDGEIDLKSAGLFADWHPFKGAFRLTAGLVSNGNQINMSGTDDGTGRYEVGDCTYQSDPADPLRVDGTVDFNSTAPYVGIGWGGNLNAEPGFFMTFDLGVLLSGAPDTSLSGRGSAQNADPVGQPQCGGFASQDVSTYPEFQQAMRDAEDEVNKETEDYELWPNIALGIGWRF